MRTTPDPIPAVDLAYQTRLVADEVNSGWARLLHSSEFVGGNTVSDFEASYAAYCRLRYCVGVGNGTDALELALRSLGIGGGDECVVPANSFIATAEAVVRAGATPVFADCHPETLLLDPDAAFDAVTCRTRAIIPVHLYGQMAPMEEFSRLRREHDLHLVEDAAQAHGASRNGWGPGTFGDVASTSFYPGKNLGAFGDAGAATTNDPELAERLFRLRQHGSTARYKHESLGFNSRLDPIQAVVLSAKLQHLTAWNSIRMEAADNYSKLLSGVTDVVLPSTLEGNAHVWHLYVVRVPRRDRVLEYLHANNIAAAVHYPLPIHLTPPFSSSRQPEGTFPNAERASQQILSLPIFPGITLAQQERTAEVLRKALA